jgi:DNA-binding CsgD family transcriptional regulator
MEYEMGFDRNTLKSGDATTAHPGAPLPSCQKVEYSEVLKTERLPSREEGLPYKEREEGLPYRELVLDILDRIGCGAVVLDNNRDVVAINSVAIEIVNRRIPNFADGSYSGAVKAIKKLLDSTCWPLDNDWVPAWQRTDNPLALIRIPSKEDIVLVLVDVGSRLQPSKGTLRRLFGLTSAESKLALGLAAGSSPDELAREIGVRKTTVRTQLASVFSKTQTSRQGELVALLARISILP